MKKYFSILVAFLFLFGTVGFVFAQAQKQDAPAKPIEGKKSEKSEKAQAVTPDKQWPEAHGACQREEAVEDLQARYAENDPCPARRYGQGNEHRQDGLKDLMARHGKQTRQEEQGKQDVVYEAERKPRAVNRRDDEYLDAQEDQECRQAPILRPEMCYVPVDGLHRAIFPIRHRMISRWGPRRFTAFARFPAKE